MSIFLPSPRWASVPAAFATLVSLLLFGIASAARPQAGEQVPQTYEILSKLNKASRMLYAQAKDRALAKAGPVIIVIGDDLVLRNGDNRKQARVIPGTYHTLKAFAHIPMAIDVALTVHADESPLDENTVHELREYRAMFPAAADAIATSGLVGEVRERQKTMVEACMRFLDSVIENRRCTAADRIAFARRMNPMIMANTSAAARAALDSMHRQVREWRAQLTPEEWQQLSVIVTGRPFRRQDNLAVQFFARLLNLPGEGERLIFAEGITDEPRALELLATRRVETRISVDFFNDRHQMARDLLAVSVRSYLPLIIDDAE
jgi:hypothetical protein